MCSETLEQFKSETKKDDILQLLHETHRHSWPRHRKKVYIKLIQHWLIRHTVAVRGKIMFAGDRIILPNTMRGHATKVTCSSSRDAGYKSTCQKALVLARNDKRHRANGRNLGMPAVSAQRPEGATTFLNFHGLK